MIEEQFIKFLSDVYVSEKTGKRLSPKSVYKYSKETMSKINRYLPKVDPVSGYKTVYEIDSIDELYRIKGLLYRYPSFQRDDSVGDNMYSNGLKRYIEFAEGFLISKYTNDPSVIDFPETVRLGTKAVERSSVIRDSLKVTQAKGACNYCCQIDNSHQSFIAQSNGKRYVEGHHLIPLCCQSMFVNSLDVLANIMVLCPNCHRLLHFAIKTERVERLSRIYDERYERFKNTGILTDKNTFIHMALEGMN